MGLFREFVLIVAGGFIGSALDMVFGWMVGAFFPDFVAMIWRPEPVANPASLGAGMGMVMGLPIGATSMTVGRVIDLIRYWLRTRTGR